MRLSSPSKWVKAGICALAVLSMASIAAAQSDAERAGARAAAEQGAQAFDEGRFADAIDLFSRAESLVHAPPHLLYMARSREKLGQLVEAREEYLKIGREKLYESAPEAFRTTQVKASAELSALEPRIPYLTITLQDPSAKDVTVRLDGAEVPAALVGVEGPVNPGKHRLVATIGDREGEPREIDIAEGVHASVELPLPAAAPVVAAPPVPEATQSTSEQGALPVAKSNHKGLRIGSYVAFGVGAVGLGAGTLFLIKAAGDKSDADDAFKACNPNCTGAQVKSIKKRDDDVASAKTMSVVGFATGAVGIAAGITLFILSNDSSSEQSRAHVTPWVGWRSAGVSGSF